MKRTFTLKFAIIAVLFFTACKREESINIDQNRIHSDYTYEYDAGKNQSTVSATFRLDNSGGKKMELSYPARVDFNGDGLSWKSISGNYQLTIPGMLSHGEFNYFDVESTAYANGIGALVAAEVPFGLNSISRSGNFFLPWNGEPLKAGETLRVKITAGTTRTFTLSAVGANHIILDRNSLDDLTAGNGTIYIERESYQGLEQSNLSGGRMTTTYKSRKVFVTITN